MKKINFKKIAKEVIETEIRSLKKLNTNINQSFNKAVEAIMACKNGKVVISGVGKSGIIGKKISSTLSSVGVPSFFVDASACSHGDLGQISSNDVFVDSFLNKTIKYEDINKKLKKILNISEFKRLKKVYPKSLKQIIDTDKKVRLKKQFYI